MLLQSLDSKHEDTIIIGVKNLYLHWRLALGSALPPSSVTRGLFSAETMINWSRYSASLGTQDILRLSSKNLHTLFVNINARFATPFSKRLREKRKLLLEAMEVLRGASAYSVSLLGESTLVATKKWLMPSKPTAFEWRSWSISYKVSYFIGKPLSGVS